MFHLTYATWGRTPLFPDPRARRAFVRALVAHFPTLVLFSLVDDHLHVVIAGDVVGPAGLLLRMLRHHSQQRIEPARVTPVDGRAHLERLVGYLARQGEKHGVAGASWLDEGGCAVDLLGARVIGFDDGRLWQHLPRRDEGWLRGQLGLPPLVAIDPRAVAPARVWEAALAAHLAEPEGRARATVRARVATVRLCAHLPSEALAALVPLRAATIRALRTRHPPDDASLDATRRWLALAAASRRGPG